MKGFATATGADGWVKLTEATERVGVPVDGPIRPWGDCKMTLQLAAAMAQRGRRPTLHPGGLRPRPVNTLGCLATAALLGLRKRTGKSWRISALC